MSESSEEYQAAVHAAALAVRLLAMHDIPKLLGAIERADATGPFFNPSLWMSKREAMMQDRELLRAAKPLHDLGKRLLEQKKIDE